MGNSEFEQKVWQLLGNIPKGKVVSYGEIAKALGKPRSARAVGNAVGKNPFAPATPCHRVVRSDGRVGGYSGGVPKKVSLLKREGINVKEGKIVDFKKRRYILTYKM